MFIASFVLGTQMMLRPAPIFADHMVLPRNSKVPIFGLGVPGKTVEVELGKFRSQTFVKPEGTWRLNLPIQPAGGPFIIKIRSAGQETILKDVYFGDIWLASGQSNMEWPVSRTKEVDAIRKGIDSQIRLFKVTRLSSEAPLREIRGSWSVATRENIANWSGIGTAFAIELRKALKIPVGIIQSTWGGTRIEAWMSQRALQSNPLLRPSFDQYLSQLSGFEQRLEKWQTEANAWDIINEKRDPGNTGFDKGWHRRDFDDSGWNDISLPVPWEQEELRDVDGASWYRYKFDMPEEWVGKGLRLELGYVGTDDLVYVNGLKLGGTQGKYKQRSYFIGNGLLREDLNVIAVRVWNRSGEGGILGPNLKLESTRGGAFMDLSTWKTRNELVIEPPTDLSRRRPERPMGPGDRNAPAGPFAGMIAPLIPFGIKGILWYQGEGNIGQSELYESAFPSLIKDWRQRWNRPDLPFYFVQLPGYKRANEPDKALWAEMRQAQLRGLDQPYTGMVVSIDQDDPDTIHPIRKYEIGRRLANLALAQTYKRNIYAFGPYASQVRMYGYKARVSFQNLYGSVKTKGKLTGFEVLGENGWVPATVEASGNGIWINAPGFTPKAVRYGWSDSPSASLFNSAGLPISPFWLTP